MLSDRYCIVSNGTIDVVMSPQDMLACDFHNTGCGGGVMIAAVDYLLDEGVVSEKCMPY